MLIVIRANLLIQWCGYNVVRFQEAVTFKPSAAGKWSGQILNWKQQLGATGAFASLKPWTSQPGLRLTGISATTRVKAILDCVALDVLGGATETAALMGSAGPAFHSIVREKLAGVIVDLSQNPCRKAFTNASGIAKCMLTSSILYSYQRDGVILPLEMLLIQGHSPTIRIPPSMMPDEMLELATMGITLPNLAALLLALCLQRAF